MPFAGSGDLDHREAVRGGIGKRDEPVEEARSGHGQADAWLLREEPGSGGRVAGIALVPEADVADARSLREPGQIRDRDADDPVDGVDVVELQRIDDQVDPIGESSWLVGTPGLRVSHGSDGHDVDPSWTMMICLTYDDFSRCGQARPRPVVNRPINASYHVVRRHPASLDGHLGPAQVSGEVSPLQVEGLVEPRSGGD